ncbi:hypothetical protein AGMMS49942_11370 [Spirochaetia bacterium]|nr:hypothetical protein AGMMS49942_11370 [Spirochaetia bacterium]
MGLNNVELYQVTLLQSDLKDISGQIMKGSVIDRAGNLLNRAAEGAINTFLGGKKE